MKETMQNDGVKSMDEEKDENSDATTYKFRFWWSKDHVFYSKVLVQKLKIGAFTSATLFCIFMFVGALFTTRWLDAVSFSNLDYMRLVQLFKLRSQLLTLCT